jgi:uncharacterized protein (DUF2147 family)
MIRKLVGGLLLASLAVFAHADVMSPVGTWVSIDDETGQKKAEITIVQTGEVLTGKITKRLLPGVDPAKLCDLCEGDRHNQPILGLQIIRDMVRQDDAEGMAWQGGTILDPEKGKTYKLRMRMEEGGHKLNLRGYIGISLFGRSQVWERVN